MRIGKLLGDHGQEKLSQRKPVLGLMLSNGWSIQNLLHSGAMTELQNHFRLLAWAMIGDKRKLQDLSSRLGVLDVQWEEFHDFPESRAHRWVRLLQKALFFARYRIATEEIILCSSLGYRSRLQKVFSKLLQKIACTQLGSIGLQMTTRLRRCLGYRRFYAPDFEKHQPDLVMSCSPLDYREDPFILQAEKVGIPVVGMVASWDNLTSKGVIDTDFDRVLIWNSLMKEEVLRYYPSYSEDQVVPIGVPRFEVYKRRLPPQFEREPFLRGLGLDPARRTLLFANSPISFFPEQPQVIRHICAAMQDGSLPSDLQLLIRCHPRDLFEVYEQFNALDHVRVWYPPELQKNRLASAEGQRPASMYEWLPDADILWTLAAMLRHSAVSINVASTMTVDAALCDVPVVSVAYDGDVTKSYYDSVEAAYEYSHQQYIVGIGANTICRSREEFIAAIRSFLHDPSKLRAERRILAQAACQFYDGNAVERLVDSLVELGR